MIFKKLTLKNFMSYLNAEVDFSGIHTACLVGVNGAGKSSLLDAVTWTIWEEGRARTDELIKLGQDEMSCEIEFFMEEDLYRIYRSRSKSFKNSQGKSNLEFQIFNPKENSWKSLSLSSTRQTQELVIKTLKMDYSTFVNSVYLRQGKADEFTTKKPSERKQILADILELDIYDKLCEASREKSKEIEQAVSLEQSLISSLKERCEEEEILKLKASEIVAVLKSEEEKLNLIKSNLSMKEKELNEKKEKEKQIQLLEKTKLSQESILKTLESQIVILKQKEDKYNSLIKEKSAIENGYKGFLDLKNNLEILEKEKEKYNRLLLEQGSYESKLKEEIQKIEQNLAVYKSKLSERNIQKDKLSEKLKNEKNFRSLYIRSQKEIKEFKNLQESIAIIEKEAFEIKRDKEDLEKDLKRISDEKLEIDRKIKTINSHQHNEPCPLCKNPIQDKKMVIQAYEKDIQGLEDETTEINKKIKEKEDSLQLKRTEYSGMKDKINNFGKVIASYIPELSQIKRELLEIKSVSSLESQMEVIKEDLEKAKEQVIALDKEMSDCEKEINQFQSLITGGESIKQFSSKLSSIKEDIADLKYDEKVHSELKLKLREKEIVVSQFNLLNQAEKEIKDVLAEKENLSLKMKSGFSEMASLSLSIEENKKQIIDLSPLSEKVEILKKEEKEKLFEVQNVRKELILNEQLLKNVDDYKLQIKDKEDKIQKSLNDIKQYDHLEKAFSKNGIQAVIIETVVPEIEKESNRILNKLTENQMHVALRTQKEKKTGGLTETLDVVIADNAGTRNYELYSGGEAFKIDFSLRLALSRLLANRSGAKLQTLIIDEGFGSQDSGGRERLTEVIRSIQNEFELILVVTHIDELKEAFPSQILVTKDEEGSKIRVI